MVVEMLPYDYSLNGWLHLFYRCVVIGVKIYLPLATYFNVNNYIIINK